MGAMAVAAEHTLRDALASPNAGTSARAAGVRGRVASIGPTEPGLELRAIPLSLSASPCVAALDLATDAVLIIDRAGTVQYANGACEALFQQAPLEGQHVLALLALEAGQLRALVEGLRATPLWRGEVDADICGRPCTLKLSVRAVDGPAGQPLSKPARKRNPSHARHADAVRHTDERFADTGVGDSDDVDDHVAVLKSETFAVVLRPMHTAQDQRAADQARPTPRSARTVFVTLARVAGEIAHELNNQIAAVLNYSFILAREFPDGTQGHAHVHELQRAAWQAAETARLLARFSGKRGTQQTALDVNQVIRDAGDVVALVAGGQAQIEHSFSDSPCLAAVRQSQVERLLVELTARLRAKLGQLARLTISTARLPGNASHSAGDGGPRTVSDRARVAAAKRSSGRVRIQFDGFVCRGPAAEAGEAQPADAVLAQACRDDRLGHACARAPGPDDAATGPRDAERARVSETMALQASYKLTIQPLANGGMRFAVDLPGL